MNDAPESWPHVARIAWLSGGMVAINNPNNPMVQVGAGIDGPLMGSFSIPSYHSLFEVLANFGLHVIGATFIVSDDEAKGLVPPDFRARAPKDSWRAWEAGQKWRQVAHAAAQAESMGLSDVASRIASGMRYSEMRLGQLAAAYSQQLRGRAARADTEEYVRFKDGNCPPVYMAIHALFWELAVLRDSLGEFAAEYAFQLDDVGTMRGLVAKLKGSAHIHPLKDELIAIADEKSAGWVASFTAYRNLFTHSAPMEQAAGIAFAVHEAKQLPSGVRLSQIYYPLPSNAAEVMKQRSRGPMFQTFEQLVAASAGRKPDRAEEPDALDYLASALDRLTELASRFLALSPVEPKMITLTDADLIGPIQVVR